jgi:ribose-phosphate pyrophosphokinase
MKPQIFAMPGAEAIAERIARKLGSTCCRLESRRFPDGETYLRVADDVAGRDVLVVAQLREPDPQLPGLLFVADALRELGAASIGLVAPYLPYLRQDMRFRSGEAVTSRSFAKLISAAFTWLVTVDPHLHRHPSLDTIYRIPSAVVPSAPAVAAWVQTQARHPCIVGPDEESLQWVSDVAALAGCPHLVFDKRRDAEGNAELVLPDPRVLQGRTPVLLDDIIASGQTMAKALHRLAGLGSAPPVCVCVHAVFAGDAAGVLQAAGAARVVSCNTLPHASNAIDLTGALAEAVRVELEAVNAGCEDAA